MVPTVDSHSAIVLHVNNSQFFAHVSGMVQPNFNPNPRDLPA